MTPAAAEGPLLPPVPADGVDADELAGLQALDGVDVAVGMAAVGGRPALYRRLLARFVQTHDVADDSWHDLFDPDRMPEARQRVHAVRGAASTLGLIAIDEAARMLESALVAGADRARLTALGSALGVDIAECIAALRVVPGIQKALDDLQRP